MQPETKDAAYLWDILQAARDILDFTTGMSFEQFAKDKKTRFAVERQLLAIGEAANHVSESFKNDHVEIPWRQVVGQRNVLAHEYGEILVERIWLVAKDKIPNIVEIVEKLLAEREK
jgi:uncharacterized protein with HEPN domain